MSIYAYTGLPGSGKSYGVVANQILPALADGRVVSTNIPLNVEAIRKRTQNGTIVEFPTSSVAEDPARIEEFAPAGCLLVIDELWKLFPAGQKVDKVPESFKRLLAEHRHMVDAKGRSTQIVFVTQDLAQISAFARQLVEQTYHHTKLGHLGLSGSYQVRTYHGAVTGSNPPVQNQLHKAVGRYKSDIFACYQSHTMSQSATSGADEKPLDGRGVFWKRPSIWGGALLVVGVVAWALPTALQALSFGGDQVEPASGAPKARAEPARLVPRVDSPGDAQPVAQVGMVKAVLINQEYPERSLVIVQSAGSNMTLAYGKHCSYDYRTEQHLCEWAGMQFTSSGISHQVEEPLIERSALD